MSVWLEKTPGSSSGNTAAMTDVIFKIECRSLPVDHATALAEALCTAQPWLKQIDNLGIHPVHVAGSQNGWQRPETAEQPLLLSRRTRLRLRVSSTHSAQLIDSLRNTSLHIDGHKLSVLDGRTSPLQPVATLFSRYTVYRDNQISPADENSFVQQVISECEGIGFSPNKILCGRSHTINNHGSDMLVRSVMLAEVPEKYSLHLQETGLGDLRLLGCGLLIPHKDTSPVNS